MPIRLYFVRHGQTEANRRHRLSGGSSNHPLTKLGISQAIMCRTTISHLKPDAIYCSPQIRACQTAEIAIEGIPNLPQIAYDDRLREREFGSIDGTFAPLKAIKVWSYEQSYIKTNYGEETLFEFELRIQDFLDMVKSNHQNQTVLVFSHGGVGTAMHAILCDNHPRTGNYFEQFHIRNGAITYFLLDE